MTLMGENQSQGQQGANKQLNNKPDAFRNQKLWTDEA